MHILMENRLRWILVLLFTPLGCERDRHFVDAGHEIARHLLRFSIIQRIVGFELRVRIKQDDGHARLVRRLQTEGSNETRAKLLKRDDQLTGLLLGSSAQYFEMSRLHITPVVARPERDGTRHH